MKVSSLRFLLTSLLALLLLSACDLNTNTEIRSGTKEDAYVDEPLSEDALQYQIYHAKSNAYVGLLSQKNYSAIYEELSPSIQPTVTPDAIKGIYDQIITTFGAPLETKQMQWWFIRTTEKNIPIILSRKLVKHEKGLLAYDFTFAADDKDMKLVGFYIRENKENK
jgi:hypothetical protein